MRNTLLIFALLITALLIAACRRTPPPLAHGKCRIETFAEGQNDDVRACVWDGYLWTCNGRTCRREGQATGEERP